MVAAKIATMQSGARTDLASIDARSQDDAAELLNVSRPSVQRATKVLKHANQNLIADVEAGKVTVSAAAQHVDAITRYPELAVIRKQKDVLTVAKNLDALAEGKSGEGLIPPPPAESHNLWGDREVRAGFSLRPVGWLDSSVRLVKGFERGGVRL